MDHDLVEGYLVRAGASYDVVGDGIWVVHDDIEHVDNIVITLAQPVVLFRVKLMELPKEPAKVASLCQRLLELNATSMVAGAYAIEGTSIIALETLQSENLDYNEFQAAIDGLTLAITEHYDELKAYHHLSAAA
jgi:hypothetical protein